MTKWVIDPSHSEVQFKVRHMMVSNVTGHFTAFQSSFESSTDSFDKAEFEFIAEIASIDTRNTDRDNHLKSADFFDAVQYPYLRFQSTSFNLNGNDIMLKGEIEIRGKRLPIELHGEYNGQAVDPYGQTKAGFELSGKISRKEFGLNWNAITEAGSIVVGDDVKIQISAQYIKK